MAVFPVPLGLHSTRLIKRNQTNPNFLLSLLQKSALFHAESTPQTLCPEQEHVPLLEANVLAGNAPFEGNEQG